MIPQAVLFQKNIPTNECREWLKQHNLKAIKRVHITSNYKRYRIQEPDYEKYIYRIKKISPEISFIIQYKK